MSVSVGAVELSRDVFCITSVDYADQALYYSKNHGRNRVTFFEDMLASGEAKVEEFDSGEINFF